MTARRNTKAAPTPEAVENTDATAEELAGDEQAAGSARLAEVVESMTLHTKNLQAARWGLVADIRTIRTEGLWVYARRADGSSYEDWKSYVTELLGDLLTDWSEASKEAFIIMLVDEGFTPAEAAGITGTSTRKAKAAVKKANEESEGKQPEPVADEGTKLEPVADQPQDGGEQKPAATPPVEATAEQKADKVCAQAIAQNERVRAVLHEMSPESRQKLRLDYGKILAEVVAAIDLLDTPAESAA